MSIKIPFLWMGEHACLDFVNTQAMIEGRLMDLLGDFGGLARWAEEAKLLSADESAQVMASASDEARAQALRQARALRRTLREMAEELAEAGEVKAEAIAEINRHLARRSGHLELAAREGGFEKRFRAPLREPRDVVARVAEAAADFLCERDLSRVKKCGNPACVLVFLDTTKSRTRRWCSMAGCGNRHKAAAHYARRKGAL